MFFHIDMRGRSYVIKFDFCVPLATRREKKGWLQRWLKLLLSALKPQKETKHNSQIGTFNSPLFSQTSHMNQTAI